VNSAADTAARPAPGASDAASATPFYIAADKIYPREVHGRFARWRVAAVIVLLGLFYGVAWLPWRGRQALLFDLPARKFYVFGLTLWPQDFFYLALLLIIAALSLFFFTALAGRLWCGYACPQTVWTELFLWIERAIEGPRAQRMKRDAGAWSWRKALRKGATQIAWLTLALYTGFTFVGYFTPIRELGHDLATATAAGWAVFWIGLYALATYGNAGFLREQVCKYMCPYARFQSAMFDRDTLIICYDEQRGEPRGARRRGSDPRERGLGDCIDCTLCVQACPTGIDIRKGLQYECIACAACIDACDGVMDRMGSPRGLIRYTTDRALRGGTHHILRPRLAVYAALLLLAITGLCYSLFTRVPLIVDILRDRNALYREVGERIENTYTVRVINQDEHTHRYVVHVQGLSGITVAEPTHPFEVRAGSVATLTVRLQAAEANAAGVHSINLRVEALDAPRLTRLEPTRFLGPQP
jgi:cytochrome c oxidase accessory protein FixG